jgi:hypothetical protein
MPYERFSASIGEPALAAVAEYWNGVRADRTMPGWRDIDPAMIKKYLPIVWSWRWDAALGTFVGRLAGEENIAVLGVNPRGKRMEECFPAGAVELVLSRYKQVMDTPALMRSQGRVYKLAGGEGWGERIVMPLGADGAHGDGVFGATVYRLGLRPTTSDKFAIDHLNEGIDFFPLK